MLDGYRAVAQATYADSLRGVEDLQRAVHALIEAPDAATLRAARDAWRAARVPYAQSEALRFGNWFVDEWESGVNAWPVDEGFLDYVDAPYLASPTNPLARANLIASEHIDIGGSTLRTDPITQTLLTTVQGRSDAETNIATGYHAIEFLLWGQDLHGHGPGAGERPWTDFARSAEHCTAGRRSAPLRHCERRRAFLLAAVVQLQLSLAQMVPVWGAQPGSYGDRLVRGPVDAGLRRVLFGLATMGGAELAGERMQVALLAGAPEEEQDCFSDDTHNSLYYNAVGIENFYFGRYGALRVGASVADLARATDPALAAAIEQSFARTQAALAAIRAAGERGERFDQLIAPGNAAGAALIESAIEALHAQTRQIEQLGLRLGLGTLDPHHPEPAS